ncbi:DinB family protein [Paenisporosarcina antarctica]|uniref:DinB family protein n=1 Tax=Paenisporosarcina antarctica TaxID=417367 RepID=A0A4P6ZXN6_9BACL|nr:DinB family protein [Paenisporosarcina antarctica]QBP41043.1 DinB family protein [Paenisporosarcina antarctica]
MFLEDNNAIRKVLFQTVEGLTDEQFNKIPSNGGWSVKQIFEHLVRMETVIATNIARELKNPDSPKSMKKPIALSTNRLIKVKAPGYTAPTKDYKVKKEMEKELHDTRLFLLDVYESSTKDVFLKKSFKHPIFGQVPLIQWFPFVGLHEKRHLKQLKKTIEML